jgi:RNA polymerase sigma-70 factor (family 1)
MNENYISGIIAGDEKSLERLIESNSSSMYHYVYAIVKDKEDAEEIVSDIFFEVWKQRKNLNDIINFRSWIYTVAYRKSISFLRKGTHLDTISFDDLDDFLFTEVTLPDNNIISKEEIKSINDAIQQLPAKCKHVFFLAKIERLPYKEISDILGISIKTINNHIATALEKISDYMKNQS